ncbi:MAG: VCBS repeat-containing protein [Saprospirales bacterium]|nr:VCBS repeat-containing protein [Saprospirales bacterium]
MTKKDVDGDGVPELFTGHDNFGKLSWQKFDNSPRRFLNPVLIPSAKGYALSMDFGDLDGDGDEDIIASFEEGSNSRVVWFEKLDEGTDYGAEDTIYINSLYGIENVKAVDFDGDGDKDAFFYIRNGFPRGAFWCENLGNAVEFSPLITISPESLHILLPHPTTWMAMEILTSLPHGPTRI